MNVGWHYMSADWSRRSFFRRALAGAMALANTNALAAPVAPRSEGRLRLFNTHTGERLDVLYRDAMGAYRRDGLDALDHILRCHYTGEVGRMDLAVVEILDGVAGRFGTDREIHIVSGYRSPQYNELLRRRSEGVARHSLHPLGKAVDMRIPGVELDQLWRTALRLRAGGVGYYPRSDFVHLDAGRVRFW